MSNISDRYAQQKQDVFLSSTLFSQIFTLYLYQLYIISVDAHSLCNAVLRALMSEQLFIICHKYK